ncbi:MAG: hypothetical protein KBF66_03090 [Rhodoferax sp.]|uniref:hypothetical protein n=1 Tax=Rhodoferax sp. TaxID=50421 RepID=UPI001B58F834|nr:hypothetical protein [Rhodoferax sp.]MBP9904517.1 hypothetical protein [Rhodoferax sp.]
MNKKTIETLAHQLGRTALISLLRICPAIGQATKEQQDVACAAMRDHAPQVIDELLDQIDEAPWVAHAAFALAALALAQAGKRAFFQVNGAASDTSD